MNVICSNFVSLLDGTTMLLILLYLKCSQKDGSGSYEISDYHRKIHNLLFCWGVHSRYWYMLYAAMGSSSVFGVIVRWWKISIYKLGPTFELKMCHFLKENPLQFAFAIRSFSLFQTLRLRRLYEVWNTKIRRSINPFRCISWGRSCSDLLQWGDVLYWWVIWE